MIRVTVAWDGDETEETRALAVARSIEFFMPIGLVDPGLTVETKHVEGCQI